MSDHEDQPDTVPQTGVTSAAESFDLPEVPENLFAEFGDPSFLDLDFDDMRNTVESSTPPGHSVEIGSRTESPKHPGSLPTFISELNDFDSPNPSFCLPAHANSTQEQPQVFETFNAMATANTARRTFNSDIPDFSPIDFEFKDPLDDDISNPLDSQFLMQDCDFLTQTDTGAKGLHHSEPSAAVSHVPIAPVDGWSRHEQSKIISPYQINGLENFVPVWGRAEKPEAKIQGNLCASSYEPEHTDLEDASDSGSYSTQMDIDQPRRNNRSNADYLSKYRESPARPRVKSIQRTKINKDYNPNPAYTPLLRAPRSWGSFKYTIAGELEPSHLFSADEINEFIWQHPVHPRSGSKRDSSLVLWIHRNPPGSSHRWPTRDGSRRCRFRDCPAENNTINQGQWAVTFDELTRDHPDHDPFLNAGYAHIYCLERFCDFPKMCQLLNVQADKRRFKREPRGTYGRNPMRMNNLPGAEQLENMVDAFIDACRHNGRPVNYPFFKDRDEEGQPYHGTLGHKMAEFMLKHRPGSVTKQELARERKAGRRGGTLINHKGDLTVEAPSRLQTRIHKNQEQLIVNPKHKRTYKSSTPNGESEDEHEDERPGDDEHDGGGLADEEEHEPYYCRQNGHVAPTAVMRPSTPRHHIHQLAEDRKFVIPANVPLPASQAQRQRSKDSGLSTTGDVQVHTAAEVDLVAYYRQKLEEAERLQATTNLARHQSSPALADEPAIKRKRAIDDDDPFPGRKRQRCPRCTEGSAGGRAQHDVNIVPSTKNLNRQPKRSLPRRETETRPNMKRARGLLEDDDERRKFGVQKRQRTSEVTEVASGQEARSDLGIVPPSANLNRLANRKPPARQKRTLEQKHAFQREGMRRMSQAAAAAPTVSPVVPSKGKAEETFNDLPSAASKKRSNEVAFSPEANFFDLSGESPSKRARLEDQSPAFRDSGLYSTMSNDDVNALPYLNSGLDFSIGFPLEMHQDTGHSQQYTQQGYIEQHNHNPRPGEYSMPMHFSPQQFPFDTSQRSYALAPIPDHGQDHLSSQNYPFQQGLLPPPPPPPDERWVNNWYQPHDDIEIARETVGKSAPPNKGLVPKKAERKAKKEQPRHSDGKRMRATVRRKTAKRDKELEHQALAEEYAHVWKDGKIDELALDAYQEPEWKNKARSADGR